ncbi:MAG: TRAP transporter small permease subunit [Pseudonocardiaceae bacterium]|nr:TRAP transporter small permease subunit [Pseudonocardiaceae bacterium]
MGPARTPGLGQVRRQHPERAPAAGAGPAGPADLTTPCGTGPGSCRTGTPEVPVSTTTEPRQPRLIRGIDAVTEVCGYLSGLCIALATVTICYSVTIRALGYSTVWQTELTVYLLIFVTFVGGAYGLKHGSHVNVDLLVARLPRRARLVVELIAVALSLALILVVLVRGVDMWLHATMEGWRSGSAWNPPLTVPYAVLPLGMALLALQYLAIAWRRIEAMRGPAGRAGRGPDDGDEGSEVAPS